jgi:glycerol-3-phosphate dehydrogenase
MGGRKILPPTRTLDLRRDPAGRPLKPGFRKAFEYSDCWVQDSRLVVLNARAAHALGARVLTRVRFLSAERQDGLWVARLQDLETGRTEEARAHALVNASGPWVDDVLRNALCRNAPARIRLVRGSHIVVRKLFDHDRAYILQNADKRIVFAIPYEDDFTLIGTTDVDHDGAAGAAVCTPEEADYLRGAVADYFARPIRPEDVVWTYSGVRPLYDDGASSATAATRDYVLQVEDEAGVAPLLNVFGGKITTYRRLAEHALSKLHAFFPAMRPAWTAGMPLPGGDFPVDGAPALIRQLQGDFPFLDAPWARRLVRAYGSEAALLLDGARRPEDLGRRFGWNLTEAEVRWLMRHEWARRAEDVLWRRSKLGLRLTAAEAEALDDWMRERAADAA